MSNFQKGCNITCSSSYVSDCHMVDYLEDSHDMMDHEKHEKLQVLDVLEDYSDEIQSLVMVEDELELPLENGYTHQRKFQLKMGLLTLIHIPCHHVLANEIYLNLKYRIGIKHFFNINLGIGIIKKDVFCLYFQHISPCFYSNFDWESSLDVELNFASNEYPPSILLMDPATPETRNT